MGREGEEESVGALPAVTEKLYKEGFGRSLYISYSVTELQCETNITMLFIVCVVMCEF